MVTVATIVRGLSRHSLRRYFASRDILLDVDWEAKAGSIAKPILAAIEGLDIETHGRLVNEAERFGALADDVGQNALYSVAPDPAFLDELSNGYERALWMFTNQPVVFQRAEEARYADERRRGKSWAGFIVDRDKELRRDPETVAKLVGAVRDRFGTKNVHIDLFDRSRRSFDGRVHRLVQATVYSEGRREEYYEFVNGDLDVRSRHPVIEACLTYEPEEGVVEVVARDRESREEYVRLFAGTLLDVDFDSDERVPIREYDLAPLLEPHAFVTDVADKIQSVRVSSLRLMPIDSPSERVTLECMSGERKTIWEMASTRFGATNPLAAGWVATQAHLVIKFLPEKGHGKGKTLSLAITMPHGCNLKDLTNRERMIGEKYLREWGLIDEL
jgi:hypothetical protein